MKTKQIIALFIALLCIGVLASCDLINEFIESRTRPIPLIQIFNSNLEKTLKMVPNDTLYVQVRGLEPDKDYTIQCLDPVDKVIVEIITMSDENGIIGISPLWYDIGFKQDEDGNLTLAEEEVALKAFYIRVFDEEAVARGKTDFRLPFFFVSSNDNFERPQPIVMAGKVVDVDGDDKFTMENAFYSDYPDHSDQELPTIDEYPDGYDGTPLTNKLYVKVASMTPLIEGDEGLTKKVRIWILPFTGDSFREGERIVDNALFYKDFTVEELMEDPAAKAYGGPTGVHMPWPVDRPTGYVDIDGLETAQKQDLIPAWAEGESFSVFLDMMDKDVRGVYEIMKEGFTSFYLDSIDGNGVAGFIVKEKPIPPADYVSLQLASGGVFRWRYNATTYRYEYDYDYRDTFIKSGYDTRWSSHSGAFWGRGVKVIWNPYRTPAGWQASGASMPSSFWGQYVNVYIVDASQSLDAKAPIIAATGTFMRRVPVQYGCSNGWWQQTIWRAPMTPGAYMIIVDMDRDGEISDFDLVDNLKSDGTKWVEGDKNIGFKVVD